MTDPRPDRPARPRLDDPAAVDQIVAAAIDEVSGRAPRPTPPARPRRSSPPIEAPTQAPPTQARRPQAPPTQAPPTQAPPSPSPRRLPASLASTAPGDTAVAVLDPPGAWADPDDDPGAGRPGDDDQDRVPSPARSALEWFVVLAGAVLVALAIKTFLFQAFYIPSGSMLPTLQIDDRVLVNKVSYDLHDVNRGDLVVFERPGLADAPADSGEADDLIKRVIGLPGDTVEVRESVVYVNGAALDEPYLPEGLQFGNAPPVVVPDDHVFVMGDNRPDSRDSRAFGPVPVDDIVGRAFLRIWPPTSVGFL